MPKLAPSIYVPQIFLGDVDVTAGALPGLNTLAFSASAVTPTTFVQNEVRTDLSAGASYQVAIGLWGYDQTNQGWTIGPISPGSGIVVPTAGQVIRVIVPNANWPANTFNTKVAAIFLKKGAGNFQLCDLAYIDPSNDFNFYIGAEPFTGTPTRTWAFLANASGDSTFGSMNPYAMKETAVGVTSGGVTYNNTVSTVSVSPDDSPDYNIVTSRGSNLTFSSLQNEVVDIIRATAGIFVKADGDNGSSIQVSQSVLLTSSAVLKGNKHIIVNEQNSDGSPVTRIYLGNLTTSQSEQTLNRTKNAVALVQFNLQTASIDTLTRGMDTVITYSRV